MEEAGTYKLDEDGYFEAVSDYLVDLTGYDRDEIVGSDSSLFHKENDQESFCQAINELLQDENTDIKTLKTVLETRNGDTVPIVVNLTLSSNDDEGEFDGVAGTILEVTLSKQQEEKLNEYETLLRTLPDTVTVTDMDGSIQEHYGFTEWTGYDEEELFDSHFSKVMTEEDAKKAMRIAQEIFNDENKEKGIYEANVITKDGEKIPHEIHLALLPPDEKGWIPGTISVLRDITKRKKLQKKLRHQALHDELTELPNRRLLLDRLQMAYRQANRSEEGFGIVFLDVDDLKTVNETLGHSAGDELLQLLAQRLRETLRGEDTVARFGGDEFVVLVRGVQERTAIESVLARIREVFEDPVRLEERTVPISVSIGVCRGSDEKEASRYLDRSEEAMRRAKRTTGTSLEWAKVPEVDASVPADPLRLEQALQEGEFAVYYQPILDLETNSVSGMEALLRWDHPEKGILPAKRFIEELETSPVMDAVGRFVSDRVCRDMHRWPKGFVDRLELGVHQNLSVRRLFNPDLVEKLLYCRENDHPVDPDPLVLEVTETALMVQKERATRRLGELSEAGFSIVLDDFGTGYSSLTHLHRWPVDGLKIDASFVLDFPGDEGSRNMVQSILSLGDQLDIDVVAEGIEDEGTQQSLLEQDCVYGQGYYLDEPMPARDIEKFFP